MTCVTLAPPVWCPLCRTNDRIQMQIVETVVNSERDETKGRHFTPIVILPEYPENILAYFVTYVS